MLEEINYAFRNAYYHFDEALNAIKIRAKKFTPGDLLNYGTRGDVSFFIAVPTDKIVELHEAEYMRNDSPSPEFLVLLPEYCADIEFHKKTKQIYFKQGYVIENGKLKVEQYTGDTHSGANPAWYIMDDRAQEKGIEITTSDLLIHNTDLIKLVQLIEADTKRNNAHIKANKLSFVHNKTGSARNKAYYSLIEAANILKQSGVKLTTSDLLHYGFLGVIRILTPVPRDRVVCPILDPKDPDMIEPKVFSFQVGERKAVLPDMLELDPDDCRKIEIYGVADQCDYKFGYLCIHGTLMPYHPSSVFTHDELYESFIGIDKNAHLYQRVFVDALDSKRWRTFFWGRVRGITLTTDDLLIIHRDLMKLISSKLVNMDPLVDADSMCPDFTIPPRTHLFLSTSSYFSLTEAAFHAKCKTSDLLKICRDKKLSLFTPVPVEISILPVRRPIKHFDEINEELSFVPKASDMPQLLCLDESDCDALINFSEKYSKGTFKDSYSIFNGKITPKLAYAFYMHADTAPGEELKCVWQTFYHNKPHSIDLTHDRIFMEQSALINLLNADPSILNSIEEVSGTSITEDNNHLAKNSAIDGLEKPNRLEAMSIASDQLVPLLKGVSAEISNSQDIDCHSNSLSVTSCETRNEFADGELHVNIDGIIENNATNPSTERYVTEDVSEVNVSVESTDKPIGIYNLKEVMKLTGYSKTSIYEKTNPNNKNYDAKFPGKHSLSNKPRSKVIFNKNEVDAWILNNLNK